MTKPGFLDRMLSRKWQSAGGFAFPQGGDVPADIAQRPGDPGAFAAMFRDHDGPVLHKWHHYMPIYNRYFGPWRGRPLRFLEIGVSLGGSLDLWRRYFGDDAVIFGIDIDPACAKLDGRSGMVRIGSQADPDFLHRVVEEMGGVDVVLDDGSHHMDHIRTSLKTLFPHLAMGGTYMIEDLHTAYWNKFGGGLRNRNNFFNDVRDVIDDMHHWYHRGAVNQPALQDHVSGLHIHDSIVVIDKAQVQRPTHSWVGDGSPYVRRQTGPDRTETDGVSR